MNGLIVSYFENSTVGIIVGRTFDGRYIIQVEDGELDILNIEYVKILLIDAEC